jgi:hypothetical protein
MDRSSGGETTETRTGPSLGRRLVSVAIFIVGLFLAVIAGVTAALNSLSCSGVIGEGCSGSASPWLGLFVGGSVLAIAAFLAWLVRTEER